MKPKLIDKPRNCHKCGNVFFSSFWQCIYCDNCLVSPKICKQCEGEYKSKNMRQMFCSKECSAESKRGVKRSPEDCEKLNKGRIESFKKNPEKYKKRYRRSSERMKISNPMFSEEIITKMKTTKANNGTLNKSPVKRGGNGVLTEPQILLSGFLGKKWINELAIPTKIKRGNGFPTCYKVDIGNKVLKIGVEIDGSSHNGKVRKALDLKKDTLLKSIGWVVLRFKNKEVMDNPKLVKRQIMSYVKGLPINNRKGIT